MKRTTNLLRSLIFVLWGIYCSTRIHAQTVDDIDVFNPITDNAIVYTKVMFTGVDNNGNYDASFVLSEPAISAWSDYFTVAAFYDEGIQVRYSGSWVATNSVSVTPGQWYHFWINVDNVAQTYNTWIQIEGMASPTLIHFDAALEIQG